MGMLGNIFNRGRATEVQAPAPGEYLPANQPETFRDQLATRSSAALDKVTQIYKQHPKLIGGIAMIAGAAILAGMKRRAR